MPKDTTTKATAAKATAPRKASTVKRARRTVRKRDAAAAVVTHEEIARRAYELHLAGSEGDAMAHWLRAERELATA